MMKGLKKWGLFSLLAAMMVFLSGCGEEFISALKPAGEVAHAQYKLLMLAISIMTLVVVVVTVIYLIAFFKFRRSVVGEDVMPKQVEGSHTLEIIWTTIPILLLLILAVPTVMTTYKLGDVAAMDEVDEDGNPVALTVNVTAKLYWWEFSYPKYDIVTSQELVVPTGEKVYFNLMAADVKHSFWVPAIGGKMDTNVDNLNRFYLVFDKESEDLKDGVFYGKCAELCGPSHALMDFKVKSLPRAEFDEWVVAMQNTADEKPVANQKGEEVFVQSGCIGCHATDATAVQGGVKQSGTQGPNLATFGDRNRVAGFMPHDAENLEDWIRDTQKNKPGNKMPSYGEDQISNDEMDALVEYLMGLKVEEK